MRVCVCVCGWERETDRQTERDRQRETDRERQTERQREPETDRQTERAEEENGMWQSLFDPPLRLSFLFHSYLWWFTDAASRV